MHDGYDIIGDIHGHDEALTALLEHMGYRRGDDGCYRHSSRQAVFVGDFIDRGPGQRRVLQTVMPMVRSGAALAVMGNHEFNALGFHTEDPAQQGTWLRPRNHKNTRQHQAFLDEYQDAKELAEVLAFFYQLPLWLDLEGLRVVHACWAPEHMAALLSCLDADKRLQASALPACCQRGHDAYEAVETLLKGEEQELPEGISFRDKDEMPRNAVRTRWWLNQAETLGEIALPPKALAHRPDIAALPVASEQLRGYPPEDKPVFFGHYWLTGQPRILAHNAACVDYSVAKGGPLVAYRWDGEEQLNDRHFWYLQ